MAFADTRIAGLFATTALFGRKAEAQDAAIAAAALAL